MPETLLDKVQTVTKKIDLFSGETTQNEDINKVNSRSKQIANFTKQARSLNTFLRDLRSNQHVKVKIELYSDDWLNSVTSFMEIYEASGRDIGKVETKKVSDFVTVSETFLNGAQEKSLDAWKNVCDDIVQMQNVSDLNVLKEDTKNKIPIKTIATQIDLLEEKRKDLPENLHSEIEELLKIHNTYQEALEKLNTEVLTPAIRKFLTAINNKTCTLADIDETVLDWLKESGRSRKYRVSAQLW